MGKNNSWDVAKGKAEKNKPKEEEEDNRGKDRKMIRIDKDIHHQVKFKLAPLQEIGIQEYIEGLIKMDIGGHIDWSTYNTD
jgi:hypothetical protein